MSELVSIIVPIFNAEKFIQKCINSLLSQTYREIEILLFDDGSRDNSLAICNEIAKKDKRIKVFSQENKGVAQTRLEAFFCSKGEYITFVDADDYVSGNYIYNMVNHLESENVDMVVCQHYNKTETGEHKVIRKVLGYFDNKGIEQIIKEKVLYDNDTQVSGIAIYLWGKLFRRKYVEKMLQAGLGLWYGEDQVCILQLLYNISSLYVSEDYDYYYIIHPEQVTQAKTLRVDFLQEQIHCWQRLIEIDKKELLKEQLPKRIMVNINRFVKRFVDMNLRFEVFKQAMKNLRDMKILKPSFAKNTIKLKWNIQILFYLFKFRLYHSMFLYLKMQSRLKKNL
ncbi:MAG: glycosyltransferase family 2 protein [Bacteroidota bacterium]|nr:glycosyltransferase family 2 protein [Bacteroidota bacterium]